MNPDAPRSLWPDPAALGALTDLYQLTMMAGYEATGKSGQRATFEVFVRKMPASRAFLVFAGLEQAKSAGVKIAWVSKRLARTMPYCWTSVAFGSGAVGGLTLLLPLEAVVAPPAIVKLDVLAIAAHIELGDWLGIATCATYLRINAFSKVGISSGQCIRVEHWVYFNL